MAKYPWGDTNLPAPNVLFPSLLGLGVVILGTTLTVAGSKGGVDAKDFPDKEDLNPICLVSVVLIIISWMGGGAQYTGQKGNGGNEGSEKVGERILMNFQEWSLSFYVLLWCHALWVNVRTSYILGVCYIVCRILYCYAYAFYGTFTYLVPMTTVPCYFYCHYMLWAIILKVQFSIDLHASVEKISPYLSFALGFLGLVSWMTVYMALGNTISGMAKKGHDWQQANPGSQPLAQA